MKFTNLLKKELGELITKQTIIMLVFVVALYVFMGSVMGAAMNGAESEENDGMITICDLDKSEFSTAVLEKLSERELKVNLVSAESDDYAAELERLDVKELIIIPEGFGKSVLEDKTAGELRLVQKLSVGGFSTAMNTLDNSDGVDAVTKAVSDAEMLKSFGLSQADIDAVNAAPEITEYTAFNGKTAKASAAGLMGMVMAQSMIAPFVIFFLLIMASSMIMTAISTEKIDKTLETLLSAPVSRMTVLMAKMTAALISALLNAGVMMIGFAFYALGMAGGVMSGISGASGTDISAEAAAGAMDSVTAMSELGLTLSGGDCVLFGLQLFLTVAIGLAVSLILGAMATDAKSVQTLNLPIMLSVLVPFFITMFLDINTISLPFKVIMYLIPFTHTYTAVSNLIAGNTLIVVLGLLYQAVFFAACMFFAVRLFTTDKIFTASFSFGQKLKKRKGGEEN